MASAAIWEADLADMAEEVRALNSFSILSILSLPCWDMELALLTSLPLFCAWISALRSAAHLEDFPYSRLVFCSFSRSTLDFVLFSTVVVVFSCTVLLEDMAVDTLEAAEEAAS